MKKFLILIILFGLLSTPIKAEELFSDRLPENVELKLDSPNEEQITLWDQVKTVLEVGAYFDKNYPKRKIEEDFSEDVKRFFPQLKPQEVYDREQTIRDGVKFYRYFSNLYQEIKKQILMPKAPPLEVDDKDYDNYVPEPYVDVGRDNLLVVNDFKKVLSYGSDIRDYEAYKAKWEKERNISESPQSGLDKISYIFSKLEWKKLPFYGLFYANPVIGHQGIGKWQKSSLDSNLRASLLAENTTIEENQRMKAVLRIQIPKGGVILAQADKQFQKPYIDSSASQNLAYMDIFYPSPKRQRGAMPQQNDKIIYKEDLVIPLLLQVEDVHKELNIAIKVKFAYCTQTSPCQEVTLTPSLKIPVGKGFPSAVKNFVTQHFNYLPTTSRKDFSIDKAVVDDSEHLLRLEMTNKGISRQPEIFISTSDNIQFSRPRVSMDGNKMTAMIDVLSKNKKLAEREIEITIALDNYNALRTRIEVEEKSLFDFEGEKLTLGMVLLAILGGFLLNLMPCVFPVLSLKILSLTEFGSHRKSAVQKNFFFTICGIFGAFSSLTIVLLIIKKLDYAVGWGMQFQNPIFLVAMAFVITLFLA